VRNLVMPLSEYVAYVVVGVKEHVIFSEQIK
jgi:hypothetical protein